MWTENVSVFALHEAGVDDRVIAMWAELRPAVLYFLRHRNGQHKAQHIQKAQTHLLKFARLAHQHFGLHELATFQLHTCLVHLGEQAYDCGPTAFAGEWWIERLMQVCIRQLRPRPQRVPSQKSMYAMQTLARKLCDHSCRAQAKYVDSA